MSSAHVSAVNAHLLDQQEHQQQQESEVTTASDKPEVEEESLARQHSDLRLIPAGWTPADADPNDPISHYDLRIVRAEPDEEAD